MREFMVIYGRTHTRDILEKEGIATIVGEWTERLGKEMTGKLEGETLVIESRKSVLRKLVKELDGGEKRY